MSNDRTITTKGIISHTKNLVEKVTGEISSEFSPTSDTKITYLLVNKILNNILSASLLIAHGCYGDSRIIIRSAFESLILQIYLIKNPHKNLQYEAENLIGGLEFLIRLVKMGTKEEGEVKEYTLTVLTPFAKSLLKLGSYNFREASPVKIIEKINKKCPKGYKYMHQSTWPKLKELAEEDFLNTRHLLSFGWLIYKYNSAIAHGELGSLSTYYASQTLRKDEHVEIMNIFRQILTILHAVVINIEYVEGKIIQRNWEKEFFALWDYLGFPRSDKAVKTFSSEILHLPEIIGLIYPDSYYERFKS